jgi:hypothetical protein
MLPLILIVEKCVIHFSPASLELAVLGF